MEYTIFIAFSSEDVLLPDNAVLQNLETYEDENIIGKLVEALSPSTSDEDSIKLGWVDQYSWLITESIKLEAYNRFARSFEEEKLRLRNQKPLAKCGDSVYILDQIDLQVGKFNFDRYYVADWHNLILH